MRKNGYLSMHKSGNRILWNEDSACVGSMGRNDLEEFQCGWRSEKRIDPTAGQQQAIQGFAGHGWGRRFHSKCDEKTLGI